MLTSDPDCYYSPMHAANAVAASIDRWRPKTVLDSNCGGGALLAAVEQHFPKIHCTGIDLDTKAIQRLRVKRPKWTLLKGDALCDDTWSKFNTVITNPVDVVVLNPPFSMGTNKGMHSTAWGEEDIRCSLSMAHVLSNLRNSSPARLVAILPESWAYSNMDAQARDLIEQRYKIEVVNTFKNSTFHGARVNSILVTMKRRRAARRTVALGHFPQEPVGTSIIRGNLPCFRALKCSTGRPFVHSTDIGSVVAVGPAKAGLTRIGPGTGSTITGASLLLPRVGLPKINNIDAVFFRETVQLSDCVLGLRFANMCEAKEAAERLRLHWFDLLALYKGTGARYITVDRLNGFVHTLGL